jgi:hypothetical protein
VLRKELKQGRWEGLQRHSSGASYNRVMEEDIPERKKGGI